MSMIAQQETKKNRPAYEFATIFTAFIAFGWNVILALGSIGLCLLILNKNDFYDLGNVVKSFVALIALIPAALAVLSSVLIMQHNNTGRFLSMALNYVGMVLAIVYLLHNWNVFVGIDGFARALYENSRLILGFVLAYTYWMIATSSAAYQKLAAIVLNVVLSYFILRFLTSLDLLSLDNLKFSISTNNQMLIGGFIAACALFWFILPRLPQTSTAQRTLRVIAVSLAFTSLVTFLIGGEGYNGLWHILKSYTEKSSPWIGTAMALVFGFLAWRMLKLGEYFGETPDQRQAWQGWLMLSPNVIGFMIFFAGPLLLSFYLGFTKSVPGSPPDFVGLRNYQHILSLQFRTMDHNDVFPADALDTKAGYAVLDTFDVGDTTVVIGAKETLFWHSLRNTIMFCLILVPLSTIPALALAILLNSKIPGMHFFRALYFLPSVAAVVGTAIIWQRLYSSDIGYINYSIGKVVEFLNSTLGTSISEPKPEWLTNPDYLLFSVIILASWQAIGFNTVLFLAGLQGVPTILYEAAYVDGANRWQQFRNVTLPLLAPTTFFVIVTTVITGLQVFNEPYALFSSTDPIPVEATTSVYYLYRKGFKGFQFGYASSVAWVLFALIFVVTLIQFRLSRNDAYDTKKK